MEHRNRYLALYLGSVVVSVLIGFIFHNIGLSLLLLLVLRLAVNIWYAQKLRLTIFMQLFVGIFSTIGLLYLLGHNPTLSPISKLLQNLLGFYEKNFKKVFTASAAFMSLAIVAVFILSYLLLSLETFGYNQAGTNLTLFVLHIAAILAYCVVLLVAFLWFYASLMYVLEPLITNEPAPSIKGAMRAGWSKLPALVGATGIKLLYVLGPFAVLLAGFLIYTTSSTVSLSIGHLKSGLFSTYSALNAFYYVAALAIYAYMWYVIIRLTFSNFGVLFSNTSILDSIRQSFWLTKGVWWAVAWRILAANFVIGSVISVTVGSFSYLTDFGGIVGFLGYAGAVGLCMLFFPLLFSVPLYIYYELRNLRLGK